MERRTKLFANTGVKKLEIYNQYMRQEGTPEKCLPRILMIIDEFQTMFTEVEPRAVETIQGLIRSLSKLARAFGCHMFFCSQSMKGTMPKDIMDQFSLRACLRSSSETSNDIIGSPIASKIRQKFGYLYSNTNMGETQDSTRLWRTPFITEEGIFEILDEVNALCIKQKEISHNAYFYNEDERYPDSILKDWFSQNQEVIEKEQRLFVLGERTSFAVNKAPVNFKLKRADGENIFFYSFEELDFNNLCMTLIDNIRANPANQLLINCADPDLFTVLDLEHWYEKGYLDIARPMSNVVDWIAYLEELIESRAEMEPDAYSPLYFMCLRWDKQLGLYRDEKFAISERWKSVITKAPAVDIHIVFGAQSSRELPSSVLTLFNHVICAKGPEEAGYKFLGDGRIAKLSEKLGFAIYQYGSTSKKFKIYQHTFLRKAEEREIKL
jgi:hypothetical protein